MTPARRDARKALSVALAVAVLAAGCSRAPRPKVAPAAADTAKTSTTPADSAKVGAKKAAAKTTRNGTAFPGTSAGSSTSAPAVVPQVSAAEQERLARETAAAIGGAQKALDLVDSTKLDPEKSRKHVIAKDFLAQANEALSRREYERAQGLAVKAKLLAEEIAAK